MSRQQPDKTKDWRGTPIEVGATVIYGAPVGRSIALVEAIVDGFTDSGRVWLKVKHRAYGGGWGSNPQQRVHVGHDRLTVVIELPPTDLPLEENKALANLKKEVSRWRQDVRDAERGNFPDWWKKPEPKYDAYARRIEQPMLSDAEAQKAALKYYRGQLKRAEKKLAKAEAA